MTKRINKMLCALLAMLMVATAVVCLAETETETVISAYEILDSESHTVYTETWEYPIVDGQRGSGRPVDDDSYTEPHHFEDGVCIDCGYEIGAPTATPTVAPTLAPEIDEPVIGPGPEFPEDGDTIGGGAGSVADDDGDADEADVAAPAAEDAYTTAAGVTLTKGVPAFEALKQVLDAIPTDTQVTITGVDAEVADELVELINNGGTPEELLALLANFPVQTIDGIDCYVVTLGYTDANGNPVTENYAFSTVDATLVQVF